MKSNQGKKKKGGNKCSNPFLDTDAVLNPFFSYERSFVQSSGSQSTASSSSTLFDESNPFNKIENNLESSKTRKKPPPPIRISSLPIPSVENHVKNDMSYAGEDDMVIVTEPDVQSDIQTQEVEPKYVEQPLEDDLEEKTIIILQDISVDNSSDNQLQTPEIVIDGLTETLLTASDTVANESNETESTAPIADLELVLPPLSPLPHTCHPSPGHIGVTETDGAVPEGGHHQTEPTEFVMYTAQPQECDNFALYREMESDHRMHNMNNQEDNGKTEEKRKGSKILFGSLKKQLNTWMTKATSKKDEKCVKNTNNVPRMTSTPVQRCQSVSVADRGQDDRPDMGYNCGGDLPPLYRTAALKRQHHMTQRWSLAGGPPIPALMSADQFYYTVPGPAFQYHPSDQGLIVTAQQLYYPTQSLMVEAPVEGDTSLMMSAPISNVYSPNIYPQVSAQCTMDYPDPVTVTTQNFLSPIPSTGITADMSI